MSNEIGDTIRIKERLGRGGFGSVYRCVDEKGNQYAFKKVEIDEEGIPNLMEMSIMMTIQHPYINGASHIQIEKNKVYIFQQLASSDLSTLIRKDKKRRHLSKETLKEWICIMAQAVACLHRQGIVHADIKPSNILVFDDTLKLSDFSLALKCWDRRYTHNTGTASYRPIECYLEEEWAFPLDIWGLGCTFYETIYGNILFSYQGKSSTPKPVIRERFIECLLYWGEYGPAGSQHYKRKPDLKVDFTPFDLSEDFHKDPLGINSLILKMLSLDPNKRPTIFNILDHPFFRESKLYPYEFTSTQQQAVPERKRRKITQWVQQHTKDPFIINLTLELYGRTYSMRSLFDDEIALGCYWIACKLAKRHSPKVNAKLHRFLRAEREICNYLSFRLHSSST